MSETIILVLIFILFTVVREWMSYRQIGKLQELLKSADINDYYNARKTASPTVSGMENQVMTQEENLIAFDDPEFDIRKVNRVYLDGQEKEIKIQ